VQSILLSVHHLSLSRHPQTVLKNISFTMQAEHRMAIVGETGSGKSTLLKVIAGLEQMTTGEVKLNGEIVKGPAEQLVPGHPRIAYLSQHFELPRFLRVEQILRYANNLSEAAAHRIFSICHINHLMTRKTNELSGGEKQRIAIARLLIQQPTLLLLDEPFSHLDIPLKKTLKEVIDSIGKKLQISCMLVSHDPADTLPWANEIMVLKNGQLVQSGTPMEIYQAPKNEYVASLFGDYTLLDGSWLKKFGLGSKVKRVFVRPEHFHLVKKKRTSVPAVITSIQYFGHYSLVEAVSSRKIFLIQTFSTRHVIGQEVYVEVVVKKDK
jgi:ABC-type Fe3+/spermidine/putrescine transport system ATPase subunit